MARTMVRTVKGRNVRPGDYYIHGLINGRTHGECFTVKGVERLGFSEFLRLYGSGDETVVITLTDDVLVERSYV